MADSTPICDVLNEAMEYLSKLGTNIRIRSENLKEKRLRKDKLRNTHAIHKAVNKVLLICELSKKSIENVETGVKNLLSQVENEGSSLKSPPKSCEKSDTEVKYEYFTYESQRLKIRNKISVEHFISVKVVSSSIALSALEKYPVYYDCKLYRMRRKMTKNELVSDDIECVISEVEDADHFRNKCIISENSNIEAKDEKCNENKCHRQMSEPSINEHIVCDSDNEKVQTENNKSLSRNIDSPECDVNDKQHDVIQMCSLNDQIMNQESDKDESYCEIKIKKQKTKKTKKLIILDDSSISDNEVVDETENSKEVSLSRSDPKKDLLVSEETSKESDQPVDRGIDAKGESLCSENGENKRLQSPTLIFKNSNIEGIGEISNENDPKINKHVQISKQSLNEDTVCDSDNGTLQVENDKCLSTDNEPLKCDENEKQHNVVQEQSLNDQLIDIELDKDKSDCEMKLKKKDFKKAKKLMENTENNNEDGDIKSAHKKKKFKHIRVIDDDSNSDKDISENSENVSPAKESKSDINTSNNIEEIKSKKENKEVDSESIKPVIKCVSLSKLLKPERISQNVDIKNMNTDELSKPKRKKRNKKREISSKRLENLQTSDEDIEDDSKYWARKREEVKKFESKLFSINIIRLPKITHYFLKQYNLKRVVERGNVLCEIFSKKNYNEDLNEAEPTTKRKKSYSFENKSIDNLDLIKVKNSLLHDSSDSEDFEMTTPCKKQGRSLNTKRDTLLNSVKEISNPVDSGDCHNSEYQSECTSFITSNSSNLNENLLQNNEKIQLSENSFNSDISTKKILETNKGELSPHKCDLDKSGEEDGTKLKIPLLDLSDNINSDFLREQDKADTVNDPLRAPGSQLFSEKEQQDNSTISGCMSGNSLTAEEKEENEYIKKSLLEESDAELQIPKKDNTSKAKDCLSKSHDGNDTETQLLNNQTDSLSNLLHDEINETEINKIKNKDEDSINKTDSQDTGQDKELQENFKDDTQQGLIHKNQDNDMIKSALLKDSSDDHSKTPKKRKTHSRGSSPLSKRKHIMESMYAKKMLLTYSSSSDTEDEQLRNTLKEIKNSLLKGISSDEEDCDKSNKNSSELDNKTDKSDTSEDSTKSDRLSQKPISKEAIKSEQSDNDSKDTRTKEPTCGSVTGNSSSEKMGRSIETPSDSHSQNSDLVDANDKEIDGLINLKSLKKTHRRRQSTSTDRTQSTRSGRNKRMAKASGLISNEGFLQAESSSDAASLSGSDQADADQEEMPQVNLPAINGVDRLAKDDLLGESDTSVDGVSHDEKSGSKKGDETDDDNVKARRRKVVAISSDSEAGSSRRKGSRNAKISDFEDSEEENSEPVKSKKKKKGNESDESGNSSTEGGTKKKRRRIKNVDDSDASGSDTENEGRNKHGRKNIRKVMGKNQLEEATKKAAREEKERIARITERQKLYNNMEFDESGKPDEVVLEKVVLDFDPETKEPLIEVDRGLVKKLKPHQANGIKFMWNACFESVKRIKKDKGSGCILAHCMGLGKTLQVVSLTHTLLTHSALTGVQRVLVVCPLSTVLNWVNEFRMWLKHAEADYEVDVYELSKFKQNSERAFQLSQWFEHGGVCVLGYEMFRNLSADNVKKFKKKMLKNFQESLVDPGPDLVVCDEGHLLKNEKTSLSQSMNRVKTLRRIVLTGTPLQNNLKEYYCMVQFVKPNLLGKYNEYLNRFVNPITNGQYTDSTEHDIRVMKRRSHVLHKMLDGAVQRRDYGVLAPFLPPKHEYVLFITLTEVQVKLYQHYLDNYSRRPLPGKSSGFLFPDFQSLQRIWTHPLVLKYNSERYEIMQQKKREREEEDSEGSLADFIDDDSTPEESSTEESSDDSSLMSDDSNKKSKKKKSAKKNKGKDSKVTARRGTRANPIEIEDDEPLQPLEEKNENPTEWWMKLVGEDELEDMRNSSKLVLLFDILRQCEAIGDKLLVFSQSLYSLDLIEHFLGKVDEATQEGRVDEKLAGHVGSWSPGVDYFRLDGSTSCENRSIWCKNFNREDNPRARLFLISTRAGGLGINLVAANRVVIFDVSWNPSHDVQSIFRVYRFGQKKPCYVYRFLAMGTMEEKIYERQVTKQAISKRVIDEQQIDRHYAENDLAELYKFEPRPPQPRPLPPLPKDRLFAEMLKEHEAQIYKYHEHDSLLENKEEETLSEEERRAAWEDFENEKTRPPPPPLLAPYAMHNGMMPSLMAQQQQQMAYAALVAMLRKDMPNANDQQIRDMQHLIYNSNPAMFGGYDYGLVQKMGEIFKYSQPGMMNPGMMNAMNAGGAGGMAGMGGSSGLQYEPPWQRQQQHQQQLRLQQLMQQQQNSMGAKYYAGGLGSRDPMAMALQQQRARELMLRPRPRGRPPHAHGVTHAPSAASVGTRVPPPAHAAALPADVVDLDSD